MKHFYSIKDIDNLPELVDSAIALKKQKEISNFGKGKTLVMLFFNGSLRTRLSTQKAAESLDMNVICMNAGDAWKWELEEGVVMDSDKAEHIKEAARVISQYADIIAIRSFPKLANKEEDYADLLFETFMKYSEVPVINLESSILHPCQSFADLITIAEHQTKTKQKIVLSWAPHPKALPQAVANSFLEWIQKTDHEVVITHPPGYELNERFTQGCKITHNQDEALKDADFVYVKNWSALEPYGKVINQDPSWMITKEKMSQTNNAYLMHCLPVRRNVVIADDVLDSDKALIIKQADNRTHAAKAVISQLLKDNY